MQDKERYIIFGIGVFLGSFILIFSYLGKYRTIQNQKETDFSNGYLPCQHILPGQDLSAKKPFHIGPALAHKDYPVNKNNTFLRILIAKGLDISLWRIEEIIWKDPHSNREKLVSRQIMHPDKLIVRLKEDRNDPNQLSELIATFNMQLIGPGRSPRLYEIKLPKADINSIPEAIDLLTTKNFIIEKVLPSYITIFK